MRHEEKVNVVKKKKEVKTVLLDPIISLRNGL